MLLSFVVPSYNEEGNVEKLYNEINRVFAEREERVEVVFVDDGSSDGTFARLRELNLLNENVRAISFSRNFGKDAAIYAGLEAARGDLVCIIDADLQQRPEVVVSMLDRLYSDPELDCVAAYQEKRHENRLVGAVKSIFYRIIGKMSDIDFMNGASDFRLMKRNMVDAVLSLPEKQRFSKGIFSYVGFKTAYVPYEVMKRESGKTKWSFKKLLRYGADGIVSFSSSPLKIANTCGTLSLLSAFTYAAVMLIRLLAFGIPFPVYFWPVAILLLVGGVQLLCVGLVGRYVASVHNEVKQRPLYFVKTDLPSRDNAASEANEEMAEYV